MNSLNKNLNTLEAINSRMEEIQIKLAELKPKKEVATAKRTEAWETFKANQTDENETKWRNLFNTEKELQEKIIRLENELSILKARSKNLNNKINKQKYGKGQPGDNN